tara:strand:- start:27635 stop:28756 length:1122 start_codon:yes stop_codon:yes gene_type:complete
MIFKINANIFYKRDSLLELKKQLFKLNLKQPLIICDKIFKKDKYITTSLKKFRYIHFLELKNEPTYEILDFLKKKYKKLKNIDCLIGIGGGSCIDTAKGLALLLKNSGPSIKYMGFPKNIKKPLPLIAVPTTVSTGTEVIYNAVFTSEKNKIKLGINSELNYPVLAILDTKIIQKSPKEIIIQSAIASLVRAIETFTSVHSTEVTKIFAKQSFNLLFDSLLNIKSFNHKTIEKLQWGSIFSMFALSNSSGGPCGVINYYLSVNYKIPQALAYNFTAFEFFKKNIEKGYSNYSELINKNITKKNKLNFFINSLSKIIFMNKERIRNAKKSLINDNKFEEKIFNQFGKFDFIPLKNNPIHLSKNDLKQVIKNIKH